MQLSFQEQFLTIRAETSKQLFKDIGKSHYKPTRLLWHAAVPSSVCLPGQ